MKQTEIIRVLLVDDESDFVETLCERLNLRGFKAEYANGGDEALKRLREKVFDVVVLDVLMPGLDGIKAYSEVRKIDSLVQVIMLTGHAKIETAIDGMKAGIYDYLIKPVKLEELVLKIEMAHRQKLVHEQRLQQKDKAVH